jgi:hypothetical protein
MESSMKTIRIGDKNYALVIFKPEHALRSTKPGVGELVKVQQVAVFEDGTTLAGNGFAFCSPQDEYEALKGVGIALGRALRQVKVGLKGSDEKNPFDPASTPRSHARFEEERRAKRSLTAEEKHQFYVLAGVAPAGK